MDFEQLSVAMGNLDEGTVKEIPEAVDNAEACRNIGADEWMHSPQKTVSTCKAWAE